MKTQRTLRDIVAPFTKNVYSFASSTATLAARRALL